MTKPTNPAEGDPIIVLDGVSKRYHRGVERGNPGGAVPWRRRLPERHRGHLALDGVSCMLVEGQTVGIIGPNGAGKTTLLRLIAGITLPSAGRVTTRGRIASLIELGVGFHPDLTGTENVHFTGAVLGMRREEIARKYDAIVDFAGIEEAMDTPVKRYSSGMLARLGFAVASHLEADVLAVDEVLSVGDADFRRRSYERMRDLAASGVTIVFVSHDLWTVGQVCDRVVTMVGGKMVDDGPAIEVIDRYGGSGAAEGGVWARSPVQVSDLVVDPISISPGGGFGVTFRLRVREVLSDAKVTLRAAGADRSPVFVREISELSPQLHTVGAWLVRGEVVSFPMTPGLYVIEVAAAQGDQQQAVLSRAKVALEIRGTVTERPEVRIHTEWSVDVEPNGNERQDLDG